MKKDILKDNAIYILSNILVVLLFLIVEILGYTIFGNNGNTTLLFSVIARVLFGGLIIFNAIYLIFTSKWSFLCINATPKKRLIFGILLGLVGLFGLITALLGYGTNGDPRLIWWN